MGTIQQLQSRLCFCDFEKVGFLTNKTKDQVKKKHCVHLKGKSILVVEDRVVHWSKTNNDGHSVKYYRNMKFYCCTNSPFKNEGESVKKRHTQLASTLQF